MEGKQKTLSFCPHGTYNLMRKSDNKLVITYIHNISTVKVLQKECTLLDHTKTKVYKIIIMFNLL